MNVVPTVGYVLTLHKLSRLYVLIFNTSAMKYRFGVPFEVLTSKLDCIHVLMCISQFQVIMFMQLDNIMCCTCM